jgi:hypothetical protein
MDEPVDDSVTILLGSLERTVRVGDAQYDRIDSAKTFVKQVVILSSQFVDSVNRYRTRRSGFFDRQVRGGLVDQSRTGKDHLQRWSYLATCLNERQLATYVGVQILKGRGIAGNRSSTPSEVEYHLTSNQRLSYGIRIANVALYAMNALQSARLETRHARPGVGEDADHSATANEVAYEIQPKEAETSSDKNSST